MDNPWWNIQKIESCGSAIPYKRDLKWKTNQRMSPVCYTLCKFHFWTQKCKNYSGRSHPKIHENGWLWGGRGMDEGQGTWSL